MLVQQLYLTRTLTFFSNPPVLVGLLLSAALLLWRFWSFTILPILYPERPIMLPYWIPWLGHSIPFFRNADDTLKRARLYFGNKREPFALVLGGQCFYIVTSASDVTAVYKNVEQLAFNEYVKDVMIRFGASPGGVAKTWDPPKTKFGHPAPTNVHFSHGEKSVSHHCERIIQSHLCPGTEMRTLQHAFLSRLHRGATWNSIPDSVVFEKANTHKVISLSKWVQHALLECVTTTFYGNAILKIEPAFLKAFAAFDETGWKLMYKIPPLFAKDLLAAKKTTQGAFDKYFDLPLSERSDSCAMIQKLETQLRGADCTVRDISAYLLMLYWGINANAWKATFWLVARIIYDPTLKKAIELEILPLISRNMSMLDLQKQLEASCPTLTAAYNETLRTTVSSITAREVMSECVIGNTRLQKGTRLIIPYRQMLLDERVFGSDAEYFNPHRFLRNPALIKDPSFRPFGGGLAYCPGRYIAQMEIMALAALFLGRFHLELHDPCAPFPQMETAKPCLGVMNTLLGQDVVLNVRPREL